MRKRTSSTCPETAAEYNISSQSSFWPIRLHYNPLRTSRALVLRFSGIIKNTIPCYRGRIHVGSICDKKLSSLEVAFLGRQFKGCHILAMSCCCSLLQRHLEVILRLHGDLRKLQLEEQSINHCVSTQTNHLKKR